MSALATRLGRRRRLRLSFAFKLFIDPSECRDPCEYAELCEPKEPDDMFVNPVSSEEMEGALKTEKLPVLSLDASFR